MSEHQAPFEDAQPDPGDAGRPVVPKRTIPPVLALVLVFTALFGVLMVLALRGNRNRQSDVDELAALQAEASSLRTQLNQELADSGMRPLEDRSESVGDIAARLKKDAEAMVELAAAFQAMLLEKDQEISAKTAELIRSEQLRLTLSSDALRLQSELQRVRGSGAEAERLRREMDIAKSERDVLSNELTKLRGAADAQSKRVSADDYNTLALRLEESERAKSFFEARAKELEKQLPKANVFVKSEEELLPAAAELIRNLRELEGKADAEVSNAYASLGASHGASVLHTLNFAAGASELQAADQDVVRKLVAEVPEGDLVLAVGYASETGDASANATLASKRATAAAELVASVKAPTQPVQAVYLGKTRRFGSPERNQIVEVWRIRKK